MAVGSLLKVKGDVSNATFFATEGLIWDYDDYDYVSGEAVRNGLTIYRAEYPVGGR